MNLQITATLSSGERTSDQNITHYQMLHLDTFNLATLSKPQVIAMVENGTKVSVANANGKQIPCAVNTRNLVGGITEKWVQGKEDGAWTDDILALPHIQDINGASGTRKFTRRSQND